MQEIIARELSKVILLQHAIRTGNVSQRSASLTSSQHLKTNDNRLSRFLDSDDDPPYATSVIQHPENLPKHWALAKEESSLRSLSDTTSNIRLLDTTSNRSSSLPSLSDKTSNTRSLDTTSNRSSSLDHTSVAVRDLDRHLEVCSTRDYTTSRTTSLTDLQTIASYSIPTGFQGLDRDQRPVLQCPFRFLDCTFDYSRFEDWFQHSLVHFQTNYSYPERPIAPVTPPTKNRCCFCEVTFYSPDGMQSWYERMRHVAQHHQFGHTLKHARPDFKLFDYFWENHLIDETEYREIKENTRDRSRTTRANSSPPSTPVPESPPVAVLNERRGPQRRHRNRAHRPVTTSSEQKPIREPLQRSRTPQNDESQERGITPISVRSRLNELPLSRMMSDNDYHGPSTQRDKLEVDTKQEDSDHFIGTLGINDGQIADMSQHHQEQQVSDVDNPGKRKPQKYLPFLSDQTGLIEFGCRRLSAACGRDT